MFTAVLFTALFVGDVSVQVGASAPAPYGCYCAPGCPCGPDCPCGCYPCYGHVGVYVAPYRPFVNVAAFRAPRERHEETVKFHWKYHRR
jgi:hypothetical protein